jgi:beta-galactosidase
MKKTNIHKTAFRLEAALLAALVFCFSAHAQQGRQRQLLDAGWRFHLNEVDGNSALTIAGIPVTQWLCMADDNATNDAAIMAAPGLDTSSWTNVTVGTDVFGGRIGYAWFRSIIVASNLPFQPVAFYFADVDDNGTVYLNGTLIGQHQGWGQPFTISDLSPAWSNGGTNVLAVAVQNTGGAGGIMGSVLMRPAWPQSPPAGIPISQWVWLADSNAPADEAAMTATNLDTSAWQNVTLGQNVFQAGAEPVWLRTPLDALAFSGRPLTLHFLGVSGNAGMYLNGILLGQSAGDGLPFDLSVPPSAWSAAGPNILAVALQSNGVSGSSLSPVILQSGSQVPPPGIPVTGWVWLNDRNAPGDAATMTATNLDTSAWAGAGIGEDLFNGSAGAVWVRVALDGFATTGQPLTMHFLGLGSNVLASVYLNGALLGQNSGAFDISTLSTVWVSGGPNILAVALQNTNGPAGLLRPALLQSGDDIQDTSPADPNFNDSSWRWVNLPHDYIVEGTFTNTAEAGHASLPLTTAWYRQSFILPASAQGQGVWIDFDAVYHNSTVWINGHYLGNWYSGYASFRYDISPYIVAGGTNVLAVHVDPHNDEGWWYEGGGIYRHVWLNIANPLHVAPWGTYVASTLNGPVTNGSANANLTMNTTLTNAASQAQECALVSQVIGPDGVSVGTVTTPVTVPGNTGTNVIQTLGVANARLWSLQCPQLYQWQTTLQTNGQTVDNGTTAFGIRSIYFDVNNGFFLNGQRVEINGMCNHQDFAGVGTGVPDNLFYWRVMKLKQMGANAWRCSHNPPAPALLEACDRLGMLVMDETRHLGDATGQKSTTNTPYGDLFELNSMILRDRNHPSIIMWSMCNEEGIQDTQAGADIFYAMKRRVLQFDTTRPITCAMNGGWGAGISLVEDLQGCNYNTGSYDSFHASFPAKPVFGSESASAVADRGEYTNDGVAYVSEFTTTPEGSWQPVGARPFMAGSFIWTGFDYKGEPSPYGWPCINSKFGNMDMCGLPKDMYYYYQAWWGSQPLLHIFPHWNWSAGQTHTVWCYGNTPTVELFLNGVSQGAQAMPALGHAAWSVPYAPGTLLVKGYDANQNVLATNQVVTTGQPASINLTTDRATLTADGEDVTVVYASIVDAQGLVVPTASNLVTFATQGAASVAGVGNGDAASHEPDRASQRNAFNGWCMALVGATNLGGAVVLTAASPGLAPATLNLQSNPTNSPPATPLGLTATPGNSQAALSWGLSFGATSYNVKRAAVSGGPYQTVAGYSAISYTDPGLNNGTPYYYVVSALNAYGESTNSTEVSVTPTAPAIPAVPAGVVAVRDDGQVDLSWNPSAAATSYNILRALTQTGPYTALASTTGTSYTDAGLTNGTTYYYEVAAVGGGGSSANSAPVSATPASMSLLVGTIIGTTGSWDNSGNTREYAFDGNLNTFFDAPTGTNDFVGLDLGTNVSTVVTKISYCPRSGFDSRMTGGIFQGANAADFSDAVNLYVITNTPTDGTMTSVPITNLNSFRYLLYLSPSNGFGNVAEVEFFSPGPHISRLTGQIIGTVGSWDNSGTTDTNALDDNLATYFDAPSPGNDDWVGLDLGLPTEITAVRYFPRSGFGYRMTNGIFQGANASDFSDAVNFFAITNTPPDATMTAQSVTNTTAFRYVRYLSPPGGYGNVAELQFFGLSNGAPTALAAPTGLAASAGHGQIGLLWTGSSGATLYNVKRSVVSGGPYTTVEITPDIGWMDSGLSSGTYYYVVSAVSASNESTNSAEAGATIACAVPTTPMGVAVTAENGALNVAWYPSSTEGAAYNVFRATASGGPYTLLASGVTTTNYIDTSAAGGTPYYYVVQAVNDCGGGTNSVEAAITSLPSPGLSIGRNGNGWLLSWPGWAGDYLVDQTTNLAFSTLWQPVTNALQSSGGMIYLSLPPGGASQQFFRLRLP